MDRELLTRVVSLAHKDTDGFLDSLTVEDGQDFNEVAIARLVEDIPAHYRNVSQSQYKRAISENANTLRKLFPDVELPEKGSFEELAEALHKSVSEAQVVEKEVEVVKDAEITRDTILNSPEGKALLREEIQRRTAELEKTSQEAKEKYEGLAERLELEDRKAVIYSHLDKALDEMKVRLSADGISRADRLNLIKSLPLFDPKRWRLDEERNPYPVDDKGERVLTDTMHEKTLHDIVRETNGFTYGFHKQDPEKSSPSPTTTRASQPRSNVQIADGADFVKQVNAAKAKGDTDRVKKLVQAWREQQAQG